MDHDTVGHKDAQDAASPHRIAPSPILGQAAPQISISSYTARIAISQAERAVDEITKKLIAAEAARDDAARKLGAVQGQIDQLTDERDARTRHVRALLSATN